MTEVYYALNAREADDLHRIAEALEDVVSLLAQLVEATKGV